MGAQVVLCVVLAFITYLFSPRADFVSGSLLYFYFPTVQGIWAIGYFAGEANLFMPILLGIPLGIFLYGLVFSFVFNYFKRDS